jgi:hypothetical protein
MHFWAKAIWDGQLLYFRCFHNGQVRCNPILAGSLRFESGLDPGQTSDWPSSA